LKIGNKTILLFVGIVYLIFFSLFFSLTGLRFILGFLAIFILPIYLLLGLFNFEQFERLTYSFFLSIGIVPTLIYYLGIMISFRIAIVVVFATLVTAWVFLRKIVY